MARATRPARLPRKELVDQARKLVPRIDKNFIELGEHLLRIRESVDNREAFIEACEELGFKYRKAMYLINIIDAMRDLKIPRKELVEVGWTKASLIAPYLRPSNWRSMLNRAKRMNVPTLQASLASGQEENHKLIVLPVKATTHRAFFTALQRLGARKQGSMMRWENLDRVVMRMVRAALDYDG